MAIVDADRIQEYIFAPRQLKLIRGASRIQRDLNLKYLPELLRKFGAGNTVAGEGLSEITDRSLGREADLDWEVVYAGGGNVYVLFRNQDRAKSFAREACLLYGRHGGSARATSAVSAWAGDFQSTLEETQRLLFARKTSPANSEAPITSPYWKSCEACGTGPASRWVRNRVTGERILCEACEKRRKASERSPYLDQIAPGMEAPEELGAIAAQSRPENYLAMVYLDVDKLGSYFERVGPLTTDSYRVLSLKIRNSVEAGVIEGCRRASKGAGSVAPFEILLLGGDDAVVVMAAQAVRPFLNGMSEVFARELPDLTFSAGIVWAHHKLPVAEYLRHAKKLLRSSKAAGGCRVDYLIVSESMVKGLEERSWDRTLRPYPLQELEGLFGAIAGWKGAGFPSSKAHQLYAMAYEEEAQGTLDYLYWLSRLESEHRGLAQRRFMGGLWEKTPRGWATAAGDIAELWDFVEAE